VGEVEGGGFPEGDEVGPGGVLVVLDWNGPFSWGQENGWGRRMVSSSWGQEDEVNYTDSLCVSLKSKRHAMGRCSDG